PPLWYGDRMGLTTASERISCSRGYSRAGMRRPTSGGLNSAGVGRKRGVTRTRIWQHREEMRQDHDKIEAGERQPQLTKPRARKGRDEVGAPQVLQLREHGRRTRTVALDRIHCRRTPRRFFGTTRRVSGPAESGNG